MANRAVRFRPLVMDGVGDPGIGRGTIRVRSLRRVPWGEVGELQSGAAGQLIIKVLGVAVTRDLPVINPGDQNCLVIENFIGPDASYPSRPSSVDYVLNPTGTSTQDAEDLPRVDPQTLGPVQVPAPSGLQAQVDQLAAAVALLQAGQVGSGQVTVDNIGGLTEPGRTALKVTGADDAAKKTAFRAAIGAGSSDVAIGTGSGQAADAAVTQSALANKAPLASPAFTGNPTAPTPAAGDNDTSVATTAFVAAALAAAGLGGPIPWSNIAGAPSRLMVPVFCLNDAQPARPTPPTGLTLTVVYFKATAPQIGGTIGSGTGAAANDLWRPWNG